MDEFPNNFNRQECIVIMKECQSQLLKDIREIFYNIITTSVQECSQLITLEFPDKLWNEHRKTLVRELVERFGKLKVEVIGSMNKFNVTKPIVTITDPIPDDIKIVTIDLIG